MTKFAVRLLTLAICAAALVALPAITPANAATKHAKKHARMVQPAASAARDPGRSPFPGNYADDFDRKNTGGGGGY
jgi:hypothetical protein